MKSRFRAGIIVTLFSAVLLTAAGCHKNQDTNANGEATKEPVVTEATSSEVVTTADTEVTAIDIGELEELDGVTLNAADRAHSLFRGMFGEEEVVLSMWIDKEVGEAQVSFVGAYHSEKLSFSCELLEDGVRYHDDKYYLLLRQQENDKMTGYFYESGTELQKLDITLDGINYSEDKEHLYQIGTNDEVEAYAQKVLDSINGYDFKAFSNYVTYPITVHVNQAIQKIETKEDFLALGEEVVFTDEFTASMANAYANIMFSNADDGVMLGDGSYNIWINLDEDGELKVTAINN